MRLHVQSARTRVQSLHTCVQPRSESTKGGKAPEIDDGSVPFGYAVMLVLGAIFDRGLGVRLCTDCTHLCVDCPRVRVDRTQDR